MTTSHFLEGTEGKPHSGMGPRPLQNKETQKWKKCTIIGAFHTHTHKHTHTHIAPTAGILAQGQQHRQADEVTVPFPADAPHREMRRQSP